MNNKRRQHVRTKKKSLIYGFISALPIIFVLTVIIGCFFYASIIHTDNSEIEATTSAVLLDTQKFEKLDCSLSASVAHTSSGKAETSTSESEMVITQNVQTFKPLDCNLSESLQEYTYNLCRAYGVDFCFAMGLMYTESGFAADAISDTDDYGLMQVNIINAEEIADKLGIYELTEPHLNIHAGLYLLGKLWKEYQGNRAKISMAYNMGETGAMHLWEKGIYETDYSKEVIAQATRYQDELEATQ